MKNNSSKNENQIPEKRKTSKETNQEKEPILKRTSKTISPLTLTFSKNLDSSEE